MSIMSKSLSIHVAALLTVLLGAGSGAETATGKLTLHVTGLNNDKGVVRIAIFNSKASYAAKDDSSDQAFKKDISKITEKASNYTFDSLPYGDYAIKIFHDEENSGKFLKGTFGIPKVQYGFSNNARGMLGPATYEKAKFTLNQPQMTMPIEMQGH